MAWNPFRFLQRSGASKHLDVPTAFTPPPADGGWQALLRRIDQLAQEGRVEALRDLQRIIARPMQSRHMAAAYLRPDHAAPESIEPFRQFGLIFGWEPTHLSLKATLVPQDRLPTAKLGRDIVLPTCWHPSSSLGLLGFIGPEPGRRPWKLDPLNHRLTWWYPLNIFSVAGGNHSIAMGILAAEGELTATSGFDMSGLLPSVAFDGHNWIEPETGKMLGTPRYREFGYLFEIGRAPSFRRPARAPATGCAPTTRSRR